MSKAEDGMYQLLTYRKATGMDADFSWTTADGHDVRARLEGRVSATFTYDDGSTLTVDQDADGVRGYTHTPAAEAGSTP